MIQEQPPSPKDVAPKYPPLMEGEHQASMKCFSCQNVQPLYIDNGNVFIAGHDYTKRNTEEIFEQANQRGGGTVSIPVGTQDKVEKKHCNGGSLKIVGYIDEEGNSISSDTPDQIPKGYIPLEASSVNFEAKTISIRVKRKNEI